ncbi:MAG TPA: DUF3493 domain-containing protein [Trichocoleus sp.]
MDKLAVNPTWNDMSEPLSSKSRLPKGMDAEKYARLRAEAKAPYKGLRKFVYGAVGASGGIGAFVFLTQLAAGRDVGAALPNFLLQLGIVGLVIGLFRWENRDRKP